MQFLFFVLFIGILVMLTWLQSDRETATINLVARPDLAPAIRADSGKHVSFGISGPGGESSWFGFFMQFFGRRSTEEVEFMIEQLAAEKDRMHMEDLAKAEKTCNVRPSLWCKTLLTRTAEKARSYGVRISNA